MRQTVVWLFLLVLCAAAPAAAAGGGGEGGALELKAGDRVVFVGGTFMEREAQLGYIETMIASRFPDQDVTFRNLGYAGDTVGVEARRICQGWANFGGPDLGFNRLQKLIEEIKPTVIVAAYGMGESFGGEEGLAPFVEKYNRLLDMLTTAGGAPAGGVRVVLLSPTYHENLGPPLPDPTTHNEMLKRYCAAIEEIAARRRARYVDLYNATAPANPKAGGGGLTGNGIHLNAYGYCVVADAIAEALFPSPPIQIHVNSDGSAGECVGATVKDGRPSKRGVAFDLLYDRLPLPTVPPSEDAADPPLRRPILTVANLPDGEYRVTVKGEEDGDMTASAKALAGGTAMPSSPRVEALRKTIVAKNADYFHYWRPQNDTYILGYRQREQGRNAVELPRFKPLVEAKEKEIAALRVPRPVKVTIE